MERDFTEVDESMPFEFESLFTIANDPRPIITVGGLSTDSYDINTQSERGQIGQINPRTHYVQFHERVAGANILLPQSIMRNREMVSNILRDEISSLKAVINREAMQLFNNVTSTGAAWTGWNGKPLLDNAHPLTDGSTNDNLISGAFSEANWVKAVEAYIAMKNISGVPYMRVPDMLLVPKESYIDALKLAGSTNVPGSNHNDINVARGTSIVVSPLITNSAYWFVMNRASMARNLLFFYQEPPRIMLNAATENTLNVIIPTRVVYSFGFVEHNWIVGSTST